jgi:hypothetical protein
LLSANFKIAILYKIAIGLYALQKCKRERQKKWEYYLKRRADFCRTSSSSVSEETRFMYHFLYTKLPAHFIGNDSGMKERKNRWSSPGFSSTHHDEMRKPSCPCIRYARPLLQGQAGGRILLSYLPEFR